MSSRIIILACASVGLNCWIAAREAGAQHCVNAGTCHKGLAIGCAPNREIFGYTPTHWRPWPTVAPTIGVPTPAAEAEPSPSDVAPAPPAEQPTPGPAPDQLIITPEEPAPFPTEQQSPFPEPETAPSEPDTEPETILPFEDRPSAPPSEQPSEIPFESPLEVPGESPSEPATPGPSSPSTQQPRTNVPRREPQLPAPPMDDAPPRMPDDDPFKDDPVEPKTGWVTPDARSGAAPLRRLELSTNGALRRGVQPPVDRRATGVAGLNATADGRGTLRRTPAGAEPRLLPSGAESRDNLAGQGMLPVSTQARRNPLRPASAAPADAQRVVAASWSAGGPAPSEAGMARRRNPLRDN